jgi:hypothetical protein
MSAVPAVLIALLWPGAADAHLVTTGLGPVYDGISRSGMRLVTFSPVLKNKLLPLPEILTMLLDGSRTDEEKFTNFFRCQIVGDEVENVAFSGRQIFNRRLLFR